MSDLSYEEFQKKWGEFQKEWDEFRAAHPEEFENESESEFAKLIAPHGEYISDRTFNKLSYLSMMLKICDAVAKDVWKDKATPEHTLALYDRLAILEAEEE